MIDLDSQNWPSFQNPYLNSLHSSPITCSNHVANVPDQLWQKIADVGESQAKSHSKRVCCLPVVLVDFKKIALLVNQEQNFHIK